MNSSEFVTLPHSHMTHAIFVFLLLCFHSSFCYTIRTPPLNGDTDNITHFIFHFIGCLLWNFVQISHCRICVLNIYLIALTSGSKQHVRHIFFFFVNSAYPHTHNGNSFKNRRAEDSHTEFHKTHTSNNPNSSNSMNKKSFRIFICVERIQSRNRVGAGFIDWVSAHRYKYLNIHWSRRLNEGESAWIYIHISFVGRRKRSAAINSTQK